MIPFGLSRLRLGIYAGIAVAFAVVLSFAGCEHHNASAARADRAAMKTLLKTRTDERDKVVEANESQQATIDAQGKALSQWASIGVKPEDVKQMLTAIAAKKVELDKLFAEIAKRKGKDDGNPDCAKLLQVDFQRVCPNRAAVLRAYENRLSGQGGPGADAGVRPAAGGTP